MRPFRLRSRSLLPWLAALVVAAAATAGRPLPSGTEDVRVPYVKGMSSYYAFVTLLRGHFKADKISIRRDTGGLVLPDKRRSDVVIEIDPIPGEMRPTDSAITLTIREQVAVDPDALLTGGYAGSTVRSILQRQGLYSLFFVKNGSVLVPCESCSSRDLLAIHDYRDGPGSTPMQVTEPTFFNIGSLLALEVRGPLPTPQRIVVPEGILGMDLREAYMMLRKAGLDHRELGDSANPVDVLRRAVGSNDLGEPSVLFNNDPKGQMFGDVGRIKWIFPKEGAVVEVDGEITKPDVLLMSMEQINVPVNSLLNQLGSVAFDALQDLGLYPVYYIMQGRVISPCPPGQNCANERVAAIGHFPLGPTYPPEIEPPHTIPPLSVGTMVAIVVPSTDG